MNLSSTDRRICADSSPVRDVEQPGELGSQFRQSRGVDVEAQTLEMTEQPRPVRLLRRLSTTVFPFTMRQSSSRYSGQGASTRASSETPRFFSARTWMPASSSSPGAGAGADRPSPTNAPSVELAEPAPAATARTRRCFDGADLEELRLLEMLAQERRRRRRGRAARRQNEKGAYRGRRNSNRKRDGSGRPPKHFLFCFPWVESERARILILRCLVSGLLMALMLTVYLSLSLTSNIGSSGFTVVLLMMVVSVAVFFCYTFVRLCIIHIRGPPAAASRKTRRVQADGYRGYADPRHPNRVVVARDEEVQGSESMGIRATPPAYGFWRGSVRVDPDRIYCMRNQHAPPAAGEKGFSSVSVASSDLRGQSRKRDRLRVARPPSYASEDGVSYVVDNGATIHGNADHGYPSYAVRG